MKLFVFILIVFCTPVFSVRADGEISMKRNDAPESFNLYAYPKTTPSAVFYDEREHAVSLADFKGKIVLMNIWSTSCAQCVIELLMLDRLQKELGGVKFQVVALSSGLEPVGALKKLWINRGLKSLKIYADSRALFAQAADVRGLPTTLLIDESGMEIGRIRGIVEWDGLKIKAQIRSLIRKAKEKERQAKEEAERLKKMEESAKAALSEPKEDVSLWFKK